MATTPSSTGLGRYLVLGAGWTLLVVGVLLLVLPGPGVAFILGGLAVLGREVPWAHRLRRRVQERLSRRRRVTPSRAGGAARPAAGPPPSPAQAGGRTPTGPEAAST